MRRRRSRGDTHTYRPCTIISHTHACVLPISVVSLLETYVSRMSPNVANVANVANERRNVANVANGAVCLQAIFALVSLREMSGDILCCMSPRTSPTSPTSPRAANVSNVSRRHTECLQETFNLEVGARGARGGPTAHSPDPLGRATRG